MILTPTVAAAEPWALFGARYQGMGGAGVATVNDGHAIHWNPGALGFMADKWSAMFPASVQLSSEGDAMSTLDFVIGMGSDVKEIRTFARNGEPLTRSELNDTLTFLRGIADIDQDGEGILGQAELGFRGNARRVGLAGVATSTTAVQPIVDTEDLKLSVDEAGGAEQVFNVVGVGEDHSTGSAKPFRQDRSQRIADRIAAKSESWSQDQAEEYVWQAERAGFETNRNDHRRALVRAARQTGEDSEAGATAFDRSVYENDSGAFVRGIIATEIGIGYGHAFEIPEVGSVSIGVVPKLIIGTTFFDFIRWDEVNSFADAVDRLLSGPTVRTSANFGLDVGLMMKPQEWLTVGLTARNINQPSFQFEGNGRYTIDPQVRAGLSYSILENWIAAFDIDVTQNNTETITAFESRQISLGTEYVVPVRSVYLALRAGAWTNLAEKSNEAWAASVGIGIQKGGFHFDFAAGSSFSTDEVDDVTLPERLNLAWNFKYEKKF